MGNAAAGLTCVSCPRSFDPLVCFHCMFRSRLHGLRVSTLGRTESTEGVPDVLQECKALNGRLINFLKERSTVEKLLQYLVQVPPREGEGEPADPKQHFKYSFAACEVCRIADLK